jgi:hypothetical protein
LPVYYGEALARRCLDLLQKLGLVRSGIVLKVDDVSGDHLLYAFKGDALGTEAEAHEAEATHQGREFEGAISTIEYFH